MQGTGENARPLDSGNKIARLPARFFLPKACVLQGVREQIDPFRQALLYEAIEDVVRRPEGEHREQAAALAAAIVAFHAEQHVLQSLFRFPTLAQRR